jgi:hypothetical protein
LEIFCFSTRALRKEVLLILKNGGEYSNLFLIPSKYLTSLSIRFAISSVGGATTCSKHRKNTLPSGYGDEER